MEFQEVMKIRERMCDEEYGCDNCPLDAFDDCKIPRIDELEEYEKVIMKWAKEHPEPQYPTWKEWQKETFPDAHIIINLCNFAKCDKPCFESNCREWPIPADIAKMLNIKPKVTGK